MKIKCIHGEADFFETSLKQYLDEGYKIICIDSTPQKMGDYRGYMIVGFYSAILQKDE